MESVDVTRCLISPEVDHHQGHAASRLGDQ